MSIENKKSDPGAEAFIEKIKYDFGENVVEKEEAIRIVRESGMALQGFPEYRNDKDVVLAAVSNVGMALGSASEELQADKEIVLAAVRENGSALHYASAELKADREVVTVAIGNMGTALNEASSELREDRELQEMARHASRGKWLPDE